MFCNLKFHNDFRSCDVYPTDGYLVEINNPAETVGMYREDIGREGAVVPLMRDGSEYWPSGQPVYWSALRRGKYAWSPVSATEL